MKKATPTLLDRAIGTVSPSWAFKRLQYRTALAQFDGASKGRRTKGWKTSNTSIQADTRSGLSVLRARARDLGQNNCYAAAAHREIPVNIVGDGITPHIDLPRPEDREQGELLIKSWFNTPACDLDGRLNFYGLQNLVMKTVVEAGECLIRRVSGAGPMSDVPVRLQVLEPDHLDTRKDGFVTGSNFVVQGVEYTARGERVAYWLFDHHPGDSQYTMVDIKSKRVPAKDVVHVFRVDRAGQVRGVPWGAPALIRMRDFDEYEDAQLVQQKIAACFSAFVIPGDQWHMAGVQQYSPRSIPKRSCLRSWNPG